ARHDVLAGILDRRLRVLLLCPSVRLLRVGGEVVEVGPDLAVRAGRLVRMAAAAAVRREERLARGRARGRLRDGSDDRLRERLDDLCLAAAGERERQQADRKEA